MQVNNLVIKNLLLQGFRITLPLVYHNRYPLTLLDFYLEREYEKAKFISIDNIVYVDSRS